jgi:hypothetical protein
MKDVPVAEYSPAEIKNAVVGTGRATKEHEQFMIQRLLRLKGPPRPSDAADGVAVALCHCNADVIAQLRAPVRPPMHALVALGYNAGEASNAVRKALDESGKLMGIDLIKAALAKVTK